MSNAEKLVAMTSNKERAEYIWWFSPRFVDPDKPREEIDALAEWLGSEVKYE